MKSKALWVFTYKYCVKEREQHNERAQFLPHFQFFFHLAMRPTTARVHTIQNETELKTQNTNIEFSSTITLTLSVLKLLFSLCSDADKK